MSPAASVAARRVIARAVLNIDSVCAELNIPVPSRPRSIVDLITALWGVGMLEAVQILLDALHAPRIRERQRLNEEREAA